MSIKGIGLAACWTVLWSALPVSAQFEIAADHFQEPAAEGRPQVSSQQRDIQSAIAGHQEQLDSLRVRIEAKSEQLEAAMQDWEANGIEAEQDLGLAARTNELERLRKALAPQIDSERQTIASLQTQLAALQQSASNSLAPSRQRRATDKKKAHVTLVSHTAMASDSIRPRR